MTPFATFKSSFPDDQLEEGDEIVVPGGRNIMRAIYHRLSRRGYRVFNFDQHSFYGWSFDSSGNEGAYWLLLQNAEPWHLQVNDARMIWTRLWKGRELFAAFIDECRICLDSIPEIGSIRWMSRQEYENLFRKGCPSDPSA
ncbi:hypothetical protein ACXR0O_09115 [Verrucomicrobiota bacterium sgz303538]